MAPALDRHIYCTVTKDEAGTRLDRWLRRHFPHLSQGMIQKHLRKGDIQLDGNKATSSTTLQDAQTIKLYRPLTTPPADFEKPLPQNVSYSDAILDEVETWICHEDGDILALNKPSGWATQGGTGIKHHVLGALEALFQRRNPEAPLKPYAVHRLDQETSGLLLVALNPFAARKLGEAFRQRRVEKTYQALVLGHFPAPEGHLTFFLKKTGEKMICLTEFEPGALESHTRYQVLQTENIHQDNGVTPCNFVKLSPLTGRTHQLRVHCLAAAGPILGDGKYGGQKAFPLGRQPLHLHAASLTFPHPREKMLTLSCPLPMVFESTLKKIKIY